MKKNGHMFFLQQVNMGTWHVGKSRIVAIKVSIIRSEWTMWRPEPSLAIIPHLILLCHTLYL